MKIPALVLALACFTLVACGTPPLEVKVPTQSMQDAYRASSGGFIGSSADAKVESRIIRSVVTSDRPVPVVTPPDIRMAYVYAWVDSDGTVHYPSWTGIAVKDFQWVIPSLGTIPMNGSLQQTPPQPERLAKPGRMPSN